MKISDPERVFDQHNAPILTDDSSVTETTLPAGARLNVNYVVTPTYPVEKQRSLHDFSWRIRVDVDDEDHEFPDGASLTAAQRTLYAIPPFFNDFLNTDEPFGVRFATALIKNEDVSTHTYYLRGKLFYIKRGVF